jgi:D-alanyl-D-alanine carboxypeptidase/D-alanyl-D-alanine-endopeptidase (penicillin-binding protein 4)
VIRTAARLLAQALAPFLAPRPVRAPARRRGTDLVARPAALALVAGLAAPARAGEAPAPPALPLPASISAALQRAQIDRGSLYLWVAPVGAEAPRLAHQADQLAHPASVMKLVTSAAALQRLGPAWQWRTGVLMDGPLRGDVLDGRLYLQGGGDPRLVIERIWLLLQRLRQLGLREIRGDIVLDRSAYDLPARDPAAFDGEPLQPYNVQPDALLLNQKTLLLRLRPDAARGVARVDTEPQLSGVQTPVDLPLDTARPCGDWRAAIGTELAASRRLRLSGHYPAACGERSWPLAYPDPAHYDAQLIEAAWQGVGGRLRGRVREGRVPAGLAPAFEFPSPPLAEVLRDMNKYSNNVIAQHVLLALAPERPARFESARAGLRSVLREGPGCTDDEVVIDNGSGLSRDERITPRCLARLLQWSWTQPWMPELLASLPVVGVDGTARRAAAAVGRAHLKTGSLANVAARAGYLHLGGGRRVVLVALLNHPLAAQPETRGVFDAIVQWALDDPELNATP